MSGHTPGFGNGVVNAERLTAECDDGTTTGRGAGAFGTDAVTVIAVAVTAAAPSNAARFA
ncbi:hypothetical protein MAUB_35290 [Mycolicibacterium aubagnense]|uniref:Uncharacterized protein n=1 Tax=Mycolicibacterium aubagnense TaxID=319707 RepID=A0ABM7IG60_9MYCO|nr:hypothetical protein MAUB_35290 [Mycolicibacterium aubagnense]